MLSDHTSCMVSTIDNTRDTCAISRYFVLLRYTVIYCDLALLVSSRSYRR